MAKLDSSVYFNTLALETALDSVRGSLTAVFITQFSDHVTTTLDTEIITKRALDIEKCDGLDLLLLRLLR